MSPKKASILGVRAYYLLFSTLRQPICSVYGVPALTITTAAASALTPSATPSAAASPDRSGSFQILADGTQDLAALVGIFATDSVEQYAVDFTRGFLSAAVSTLSLLGLLGWVRTMMKLALGQENCKRAGFASSSLRPLYGLPKTESIADKVYEVLHVKRSEEGLNVKLTLKKTVRHTSDTIPWLPKVPRYEGWSCLIEARLSKNHWLSKAWSILLIGLVLCCCNGATCFAIAPFRGTYRAWTWSTHFATFGLFATTTAGSLVWCWIYLREHVPSGTSSWASVGQGDQEIIYCKIDPALDMLWGAARGLSFVITILAVTGYVCQYIEVRQISARQSGIWLALQGALALIRVLVWITDPSIDDISFGHDTLVQNLDYQALHAHLQFSNPLSHMNVFSFPLWISPFLEKVQYMDNVFAWKSAKDIRDGNSVSILAQLRSLDAWWPMPDNHFTDWIQYQGNPSFVRFQIKYSCLVARDPYIDFHIMPYLVFYLSFVRGEFCLVKDRSNEMILIVAIGVFFVGDDANCLIMVTDDLQVPKFVTDWNSPLPKNIIRSLRASIDNVPPESLSIKSLLSEDSFNAFLVEAKKDLSIMWEHIKSAFPASKDRPEIPRYQRQSLQQPPGHNPLENPSQPAQTEEINSLFDRPQLTRSNPEPIERRRSVGDPRLGQNNWHAFNSAVQE